MYIKKFYPCSFRLFWTSDSGFLSQFEGAGPDTKVTYKQVSKYPQVTVLLLLLLFIFSEHQRY